MKAVMLGLSDVAAELKFTSPANQRSTDGSVDSTRQAPILDTVTDAMETNAVDVAAESSTLRATPVEAPREIAVT